MRVDAGVERARLRKLRPDSAVGIDCVHGHSARIVVRHQQISPLRVARDVNGTGAERRRLSHRVQGAIRFDSEWRDAVAGVLRFDAGARIAGASIAPGHVEEATAR